ncbi:phage holin family protein [Mycolicibacterium rhodesiae]|uniref:Phage holin family protein n=1 Tax=Mycolicibacterium rhodesiae TaxID=36814 RepID=A0A1X0J261_MYCRH|nr:phage holin family protein [Mycolicibacterium rhodesiae]MCV7344593.1 phage holin family protein [Mycolicibacterium rhodesiae]ORB55921.1 hypothetical protein BST42_05860 [Mycolicibacterium rhodesiae]
MSSETGQAADAPLGELVSQLSAQTSRLVRDELRLAQKEFQDSARHAGVGAGLISMAGLLALFGALALLAAAIAALALVLPVWAAALIAGAVLLVIAGMTALLSRAQLEQVTPAAPEAVASVKKDIHEVKGAAHVRG